MINIPYIKQEKRQLMDMYVIDIENLHLSMSALTDFLLCISGSLAFAFYDKGTLVKEIREDVKPDGSLNYILFKYAKYNIEPSYNNYKNYMGAIYEASNKSMDIEYRNEYREAAEWIRIKLLIPYEENTIIRNGDI